jgi:hypothetical protein
MGPLTYLLDDLFAGQGVGIQQDVEDDVREEDKRRLDMVLNHAAARLVQPPRPATARHGTFM